MMKQSKFTLLLLLMTVFLSQTAFGMVEKVSRTTPENASLTPSKWYQDNNKQAELQGLSPEMTQMKMEEFLTLTPSKFEEMTGKKLSWKKKVELKLAQKFLKKKAAGADISKGLYVVLAIIGFGWLAMGLLDDWNGSDWIIALVLSLLFWLPGVIFSLIKMNKYYK